LINCWSERRTGWLSVATMTLEIVSTYEVLNRIIVYVCRFYLVSICNSGIVMSDRNLFITVSGVISDVARREVHCMTSSRTRANVCPPVLWAPGACWFSTRPWLGLRVQAISTSYSYSERRVTSALALQCVTWPRRLTFVTAVSATRLQVTTLPAWIFSPAAATSTIWRSSQTVLSVPSRRQLMATLSLDDSFHFF